MDKLTYLAELAEGLARWVPERERQDILRYYAEYFEEAGPEREAQVVAELGDPWALSCRLAVEGGFVSQEQAERWTPPKKKRWPWVVAGVAAAVMVFVIWSVASAASLFGRVIGQVVYSNVGAVTEEFAQVVPVDPGTGEITFIEGEEAMVGTFDVGGGIWAVEDGSLEAFDKVDVDVSIANVTVTGGEDYTLWISSNTTLGGYSLKWEVKNGTLKIRDGDVAGHMKVNSWEDFKNIFGVNATAMDVVITVPDTGSFGEAKVKTGLGDVYMAQLWAGKVEAETGLGDMECFDLWKARKVELETGLGDIALGLDELYNGVEIDLETGLGTVEASLNCKEQDCEYVAKTGAGEVTVNGEDRGTKAQRKTDSRYQLEIESGVGDVNLFFKDDRW